MDEFPELKLRFWMNAPLGKLNRLKSFASVWWNEVRRMIFILPLAADPLTAELSIVDKLASERGITRLKAESEPLYRLRVKHAFENVRDAGSKAGFERIFERLGYRLADTLERDPAEPDVVFLEISGDTPGWFADEMVRLYGCTCRRYQIQSALSIDLFTAAFVIENHVETVTASGSGGEVDIPEGMIISGGGDILQSNHSGFITTSHLKAAEILPVQGAILLNASDGTFKIFNI